MPMQQPLPAMRTQPLLKPKSSRLEALLLHQIQGYYHASAYCGSEVVSRLCRASAQQQAKPAPEASTSSCV